MILLPHANRAVAQQSNNHIGQLLPVGCSNRAWNDAFHPNAPVHPAAYDTCPANIDSALFTREGTLACPTPDMLSAAFNAMENNWHLVASAGIPMTYQGAGRVVGPAYFGCSIYHDGIPVTRPALQNGGGYYVSPIGWVPSGNLRNSVQYMEKLTATRDAALKNSMRPKLCYPGGRCVYTDTRPYQPVVN